MTTPPRVFTDADADLSVLGGRTAAILGFGNQGSAQAQNLRDSGVTVIVGNRDDEYRERAAAAGFRPAGIAGAAAAGQVVLLLIPDEVQPQVFREQVAPHLQAGDTLVVASGYNWSFGLLDVPDGVDVVMVAPRMIGEAVRARYLAGEGYPCFVSVERDATGNALGTALAVARGIGGTAGGAVASSAREEATLDLFSEQAIWPAIFDVLHTAYEVLHDAGFSDEAILYEMYLSAEPAEIFARAAATGLIGQLGVHSQTSQYGQLRALRALRAGPGALRERFERVLREDIQSGAFAREWSRACDDADARLARLRAEAAARPIAAAERAVMERARSRAAARSRPDGGEGQR
jgi:ketol-acid reductoisomerase